MSTKQISFRGYEFELNINDETEDIAIIAQRIDPFQPKEAWAWTHTFLPLPELP